jgi:hypothetical protein
MFMINFKLISLSICGGSKEMPRHLDLALFIIFVYLFYCLLYFNFKTISAHIFIPMLYLINDCVLKKL